MAILVRIRSFASINEKKTNKVIFEIAINRMKTKFITEKLNANLMWVKMTSLSNQNHLRNHISNVNPVTFLVTEDILLRGATLNNKTTTEMTGPYLMSIIKFKLALKTTRTKYKWHYKCDVKYRKIWHFTNE